MSNNLNWTVAYKTVFGEKKVESFKDKKEATARYEALIARTYGSLGDIAGVSKPIQSGAKVKESKEQKTPKKCESWVVDYKRLFDSEIESEEFDNLTDANEFYNRLMDNEEGYEFIDAPREVDGVEECGGSSAASLGATPTAVVRQNDEAKKNENLTDKEEHEWYRFWFDDVKKHIVPGKSGSVEHNCKMLPYSDVRQMWGVAAMAKELCDNFRRYLSYRGYTNSKGSPFAQISWRAEDAGDLLTAMNKADGTPIESKKFESAEMTEEAVTALLDELNLVVDKKWFDGNKTIPVFDCRDVLDEGGELVSVRVEPPYEARVWFTDRNPRNNSYTEGIETIEELRATLKKFFDMETSESKKSEEKDRLAGYKPYSFKVKSKDPSVLKNDAEAVLAEFAEDVADNTSFKFDYDWYDRSWELTDTKTNQVFSKGTFLFKDFAESPLYLDDGVLAKPAGMKLRIWVAVSDADESKKSEANGDEAKLQAAYGDGGIITHESSADGFYVNDHDPMGYAILNNDVATMKELFAGTASVPEKPWTYAGWHEDIDAPEDKDGNYPYVYDWERENDTNFVNDWKRVVGETNNEEALNLLLEKAPDFVPTAIDFYNAFHAGYDKKLLRKLLDNISTVVDKEDISREYLNYEEFGEDAYDNLDKFLDASESCKSEALPPKQWGDRARKFPSRAALVNKAKTLGATEITSHDDYKKLNDDVFFDKIGFAMDINGNCKARLWWGEKDGKYYYSITRDVLDKSVW